MRSSVGDGRDGLRRTRAPNRRTEICRNDTPCSQRAEPVNCGEREPLQADGESGSSDIVALASRGAEGSALAGPSAAAAPLHRQQLRVEARA
jgi:hypothetical protein